MKQRRSYENDPPTNRHTHLVEGRKWPGGEKADDDDAIEPYAPDFSLSLSLSPWFCWGCLFPAILKCIATNCWRRCNIQRLLINSPLESVVLDEKPSTTNYYPAGNATNRELLTHSRRLDSRNFFSLMLRDIVPSFLETFGSCDTRLQK